MNYKKVNLTVEEKNQLEEIIKKGVDWRERERAGTILMLLEDRNVDEIAEIQGLHPEVIRVRRRKWWKEGFASLCDRPRSGVPNKLNDTHRAALKDWASNEALSCRELLTRLKTEYDVTVCATTLRNELKKMSFVWKRTRYSLKKKRDEERFVAAKQDIERLQQQAEQGQIELAYFDEAGFTAQPPNRSAWTLSGAVHSVTAERGQRLNLMGALFSSGKILFCPLWESINAMKVMGFLTAMTERIKKPLVVILDNASIHKAKILKPYLDMLAEKGLRLYFLPPYSPELNRIEILWRKMKYEWLPFKSFKPDELEEAIGEIGGNLGTKYNLTFC